MAFIQWLIPILAPALSGLVGVWLGARLVDRRERRELKLRAYGEVLKVLVEADEATRAVQIVAGDVSMAELKKEELSRAVEIQGRLHQAVLIAMITVGDAAGAALATFEVEWNDATAEKTLAEIAQRRRQAIDRTQAALLTAARRELKTR
jgi:hypothetical protein